MSRLSRLDIVNELVDLIKDLSQDVTQQLQYYRASVYKQETSAAILQKIDHLRIISQLLGHAELDDLFNDFDASAGNGNVRLSQGECLFSHRVTTLTRSLLALVDDLPNIEREVLKSSQQEETFRLRLRSQRGRLMNLCGHGSRGWRLFQSL